MAFSLNRAQVIGNVTKDPEVRMAGAQKVATFSVATNMTWKDPSGAKKEKAEFHNVVVWRHLAEICEQYVRKGGKIFVEGRMQTREWEGEDGVKRYRTEIVADNIIMLGGRGDSASPSNSSAGEGRFQRPVRAGKSQEEPATEEEVSIDDLPF